ncbi:MAG: BclB C-terminal protein [Nocardioides sp.]|uniref:hypothetical protein n=1 Tax=Nocardioides sp. TaxID=35761 RepID=UPI0026353D36|nr:hypothetical protein [Nocardioides sp.]MCW2832081.1 BclB C-terminal protein [Nocardioides sp.]
MDSASTLRCPRSRVQPWTSSNQSNYFSPVPGATCTTPVDISFPGSIAHCSATGLSVPLTNQTQAILVVRSENRSGLPEDLFGYWSAGLQLS